MDLTHKASLEPNNLSEMIILIRLSEKSLGCGKIQITKKSLKK